MAQGGRGVYPRYVARGPGQGWARYRPGHSAVRLTARGSAAPFALLGAAFVLYLALSLPQLGRPLLYDEVDFAKAARAVASGTWRYDRGYIADYPWDAESGRRLQYPLYHPPGYILALAAWQRVAGVSDAALRGFGVLCGLATLAVVAALGRLAGGPLAAGAAALLWAASPYAIQASLLLDVDGTLLAPATGLFVWLVARRLWTGHAPHLVPESCHLRWRCLAAPALAFAVALWLKLTTPVAVAALLILWLALGGRRAAAWRLAAACLAGALAFALSWWLVALGGGLSPAQPFRDLLYESLDTLGLAGAPAAAGRPLLPLRMLAGALRTAQWLHPCAIALLVAAPLSLRRSEPAAALLFVTGAAVTLYLVKLAAGFPKYHAGVLPLAAAVLGTMLARWLSSPGRRAAAYAGLGLALGGVATAAAGPDALLRQADPRLIAAWLAAATACLGLARWAGAWRMGPLAFGLLLGANGTLAVFQATAPWSPTYFYGTDGQVMAATWLAAAARSGEVVAADREVAYYAPQVRFLDSERLLFPASLAAAVPGDPADAAPPLGCLRLLVSRYDRAAAVLFAPRLAGTFGAYRAWIASPAPDCSAVGDRR